jgi:hypothetical protein
MKTPKIPKATIAILRKISGAMFRLVTKYDNTSPVIEKVKIKPKAINSGLVLLVWPTDAPSKIGNKGRMHGAPIVRAPAIIAKRICSII